MPSDLDQEFLRAAEERMRTLLRVLDRFDPDELEAESAAGVIKLQFADGRSAVLNRQSAARQIWLAEGAEAWHFALDPASGDWRDTKGRGELTEVLGQILSRRLDRTVEL